MHGQQRKLSAMILSLKFAILLAISLNTVHGTADDDNVCIYEGRVRSDDEWYGYLAVIAQANSESLRFEFSYPADECCPNILFYLEDQSSRISPGMSCSEKEGLLQPENNQIMQLSPTNLWSGCRMTHKGSVTTYVCVGRLYFHLGDRQRNIYMAVSNCDGIRGLDLAYRIEVTRQTGNCPDAFDATTTDSSNNNHVHLSRATQQPCVVDGTVDVRDNWYGFVANLSLEAGQGFRYVFTYPYAKQVQNVILYNQHDIQMLSAAQSCWQKGGIILAHSAATRVIDLSSRSSWNGCVTQHSATGQLLVCSGERRFEDPEEVYIALANCRTRSGLYLEYRLERIGDERCN